LQSEIHDGSHPECAPCFAHKIHSLSWQTGEAAKRRAEDSTFSKDMDAYKRLRISGVQPKQIGGSAEIEAQATEKWEAEHGVIMRRKVRKEFIPRLTETAK